MGDRGLLLLLLALSNSEWKNLRLIFFSLSLSFPSVGMMLWHLFFSVCLLQTQQRDRARESWINLH